MGSSVAVRDEGVTPPSTDKSVLDITVLMGGPSSEREVSLASGRAIADGLRKAGHQVTTADISPTDTSALDREGIDVVFIALHGDFGESGQVQALCEQKQLRYIGSDPRSSKYALDKAASKQLLLHAGLATPRWMVIELFHPPALRQRWLGELPPPVVCKPVDGGSSVDVTIARDPDQRDRAVEDLLDNYGRAMIEQFVAGREVTVGILGDQPLPVIEIVCRGEFYDYQAKYADDAGTEYRFDHGLDADTVGRLQADALAAHRALGCRDLSRVDFILDPAGTAHVLEVNTIPGFTSHSLLPKAAQRAGIAMDRLVDRIARMAMTR
jgi:D-alanine-D-alanine ligase